jgi:hypothetical protein
VHKVGPSSSSCVKVENEWSCTSFPLCRSVQGKLLLLFYCTCVRNGKCMLVLYHLFWVCIVRCFVDLVTDYRGEAVCKKANSTMYILL